jgi:predicted DNA binding CopG/RHH family protein
MSNLNAGRPSKSNQGSSLSLDDLVETEKTKRVNFDLPESQHRKLKEYAASQGMTIREVLTQYVETLLK